MIEIPRSTPGQPPRLKVIGVGSAGCNMLDRLVLDGFLGAELIAVNTDAQALVGCVAPQRIQIGQNATRGLGTGGDPDLGFAAAEESMAELTAGIGDDDLVFLLGGLGGGTASGAIPALSQAIRERGAHVVVIATLPFAFEGRRRQTQAFESLDGLRESADLLICFENDRMGEVVSARSGIQEAFVAVDALLSQCLRSLGALTQRKGLLQAGFSELAAVFHQADLRALFGAGEGAGDNRAHQAAEALLKSPLLHRGRHLREIEAAVIHVAGGEDLTFSEVQTALEEIRKHLPEDAQTFLTLAVDSALAGQMSITLLAALPMEEPAAAPAVAAPARPAVTRPATAAPAPTRRTLIPSFEQQEIFSQREAVAAAEDAAAAAQAAASAAAHAAASVHGDSEDYSGANAAESLEYDTSEYEQDYVASAESNTDVESREYAGQEAEEDAYAEHDTAAGSHPGEEQVDGETEYTEAPVETRPRMRPLFAPMQGTNTRRTPAAAPVARSTPAPSLPYAPPAAAAAPKAREAKQEQMMFEPVNRGRFEKSEPTIIDGQDLDVPTFLRRNLRLK